MKKLLFILLLLPQFAKAGNNNVDSIYQFINQVLSDKIKLDSFYKGENYILDKVNFKAFDKRLFSRNYLDANNGPITDIINILDSASIYNNINSLETFQLDENKLINSKLVSNSKIHKVFNRRYKDGWYYLNKKMGVYRYFEISIPIFFDSGRKAIFYYGLFCGGLCGEQILSVYENINGLWIVKRELSRTMI
ncbi:MAG: hypothetical protein WCG87_09980 [Bacteroidota bacterium]